MALEPSPVSLRSRFRPSTFIQGQLNLATLANNGVIIGPQGSASIANATNAEINGTLLGVPVISGNVVFKPLPGQPDVIGPIDRLTAAGPGASEIDGGYIFVGQGNPPQPGTSNSGQAGIFDDLLTQNVFTLGPHLTIDFVQATAISGPQVAGSTPTIINDGLFNITPGAYVGIGGFVTNNGSITLTSGQLVVQYANAFGGFIRFADGAGALSLGYSQVNATLSGLRPGDTVDLFNIAFSGAALTTSGNVLGVTENGAVAAQLTLQDHTSLDPNAFTLTPDSTGGTVVRTTAAPTATVAFSDATNSDSGTLALDPAGAGAPAFLQYQYLDTSADSVAMAATVPNVFLKGGSGNKALSASSGTNVLDGGTGGAFLTGGTGQDTFFVDVRSANAFVWDTIANFHQGDVLTMWGFVPGTSATSFSGQQGAAGYTGATLNLDLGGTGATNARVTFAGLSDAQGGNLTTATGTVGGLTYLTLTNLGV